MPWLGKFLSVSTEVTCSTIVPQAVELARHCSQAWGGHLRQEVPWAEPWEAQAQPLLGSPCSFVQLLGNKSLYLYVLKDIFGSTFYPTNHWFVGNDAKNTRLASGTRGAPTPSVRCSPVNLHQHFLVSSPAQSTRTTQVSETLEYNRETHINPETNMVQSSIGYIKGIGRVWGTPSRGKIHMWGGEGKSQMKWWSWLGSGEKCAYQRREGTTCVQGWGGQPGEPSSIFRSHEVSGLQGIGWCPGRCSPLRALATSRGS